MSGSIAFPGECCTSGGDSAASSQATSTVQNVNWYAVWTRSRHEKVVSSRLSALRVSHYLPLSSEVRQWSDRRQVTNVPLFPGYLFIQIDPLSKATPIVLTTPGVIGILGNARGPLPIPCTEIESVRWLLEYGVPCSSQPLLSRGDQVRVVRGPLTGIVGSLIRVGSKFQLIISIELIGRSVAVTVAESDVEHFAKSSAPSLVN